MNHFPAEYNVNMHADFMPKKACLSTLPSLIVGRVLEEGGVWIFWKETFDSLQCFEYVKYDLM